MILRLGLNVGLNPTYYINRKGWVEGVLRNVLRMG